MGRIEIVEGVYVLVGEHYLYVSTDKEIFEIKLTRQFTVLQGDSGTGKSFITSAIEEKVRNLTIG